MDNLTLELDFTGVNAASGGLGYLSAGLHSAKVVEFSHFEDSGRLYAYMVTNGVRHRDSFNATSPAALPFLKAFLLSAGVDENKMDGKSKIPFHKIVGRAVYFNYTPPELDTSGKAMQGSYPKYTFYSKERYAQMQEVMNLTPEDVQVEGTNGGGAPVAQAASANQSAEDFDFLADE